MKSEKNILIAFILNFSFAIFEFIGGIFTGSIAIMSDSIHDIGDALSIGLAFFFEKKSRQKADSIYSFGYQRYSVLGGMITTVILICGAIFVMISAVNKILNPTKIDYDGMLLFAVLGLIINFMAAYATHGGHSVNQKAVNLHMLEDVLGWIVVLIGAIIMKFTDVSIIDPLMSIALSVFILTASVKNLKEIFEILLDKVPKEISLDEIKAKIIEISGIRHVEQLHIWSMDGQTIYSTMHVEAEGDFSLIRITIRKILSEYGIGNVTLEITQ